MTDPVVVVGAGPVGLAAALMLRAREVPVRVVEAAAADAARPGSRAIFVHKESLRLLEEASPGLGRGLADAGLVWPTRRSTFRGRTVYARTYPPPRPDQLPPSTSLPQVDTERILLAACRKAGVEIAFGCPVTTASTDPAGVELVLESGDRIRAPYVVAADGARSGVRAALGIALSGPRSAVPFVIVDVDEVPADPMPRERVFHYEHPAVGRRNVLLVPFAGGWRVDLQCRPDDDDTDFNRPPGLTRWLTAVIGARYAERVRWVSTYRFHQAVADTFTDPHRRVLLVGEAAHLFAPFGARGMNSGFADAAAAAAAIYQELRPGAGRAGDPAERRTGAAVAAFAADRRDAALYNRAAAGAALAHMRAADPLTRLRRRLAAAVAPRVERAGRWLDTAPYGPRVGRAGSAGKY